MMARVIRPDRVFAALLISQSIPQGLLTSRKFKESSSVSRLDIVDNWRP